MTTRRSTLLARITSWAAAQDDIRLAALLGSAARHDHPADEWSDLDLLVIAVDPQIYLASTGWLTAIGEPWFTFIMEWGAPETPVERRVLFAGGQDVDFIIFPVETVRRGFAGTFVPEIAARGLRVLLDKDGLQPVLPVPPARPLIQPPLEDSFAETVSDFWFHAAWTAKKLRRGELWVAKRCCDDYLKRLLLRMLEWQVQAAAEGAVDTWYNGRFLEQWAGPAVLEKLRPAFAHYDEEDIWRALRASMNLFTELAVEVAARWDYAYPAANATQVKQWVEACACRQARLGAV